MITCFRFFSFAFLFCILIIAIDLSICFLFDLLFPSSSSYRVTGLLKSGAISQAERPLWYDVYRAFPPAQDPSLSRPAPDINIPKLVYPEDLVRAYALIFVNYRMIVDFFVTCHFNFFSIAENFIDVMEWQPTRNQ